MNNEIFKLKWLDYNESFIANAQVPILLIRRYAVGDPDLQIRGGGGGSGHPDPEIRSGQSPKNFFRPFGPQFGLKIRGAPPRPLPWIRHWYSVLFNDDKIRFDVRESKIVLDAGFCVVDSDSRCWTPDLCQWTLDSGIPILRGIPDF